MEYIVFDIITIIKYLSQYDKLSENNLQILSILIHFIGGKTFVNKENFPSEKINNFFSKHREKAHRSILSKL